VSDRCRYVLRFEDRQPIIWFVTHKYRVMSERVRESVSESVVIVELSCTHAGQSVPRIDLFLTPQAASKLVQSDDVTNYYFTFFQTVLPTKYYITIDSAVTKTENRTLVEARNPSILFLSAIADHSTSLT
jgi:hypothetical protein